MTRVAWMEGSELEVWIRGRMLVRRRGHLGWWVLCFGTGKTEGYLSLGLALGEPRRGTISRLEVPPSMHASCMLSKLLPGGISKFSFSLLDATLVEIGACVVMVSEASWSNMVKLHDSFLNCPRCILGGERSRVRG